MEGNHMEIELWRAGGFAPVPSAARRLIIDTTKLSPENSALLQELVTAARLDIRPTVSPPPKGAADYRIYTLTVTYADHTRSLEFTELDSDPQLMALVKTIQRLSTSQP